MSKNEGFAMHLNACGLRATPNRLAILLFMEQQERPIGVDALSKHFPKVNLVTLYRMATDFVEKGIWNAYDLGHGHVDYELADRPHHHHLVCQGCGDVEDVYACDKECRMEQLILKKSKKFGNIQKQTATFFGTCNACVSGKKTSSKGDFCAH